MANKRTGKAKRAITHEMIRDAIVRFKKEGGIIKKLPDQGTPRRYFVGGRYAQYEDPFSLSSISNS